MKLRNKKTGEIVEWFNNTDGIFPNSLAELNSEWEDCEEPKEYWYIDSCGTAIQAVYRDNEWHELRKQIGDYFGTKEEAEKAVEKLKAWKRLRDKGFMFCGTDCINKNNVICFEFGERPLTQSEADEADKDLDLLFGGEE